MIVCYVFGSVYHIDNANITSDSFVARTSFSSALFLSSKLPPCPPDTADTGLPEKLRGFPPGERFECESPVAHWGRGELANCWIGGSL